MQPSGLVLLYHRISDSPNDPQLLAVSPENFLRHLEILTARCQPVPLSQLMRDTPDRRASRRLVSITFDDGYADNLHTGRPLLERFGVPAAIFVTSAYVGASREFWWDELERLLLLPSRLPPKLELPVGRSMMRWDLHTASVYQMEDAKLHADWHVERRDDPTVRHEIYRQLHRALRPLPGVQRDETLRALAAATVEPAVPRTTHRALDRDELGRLLDGGVFELGAHTLTHPVLSALPEPEQRHEIEGSRAALREMTGHAVHGFAYPYGGSGDYTTVTTRLVREAGFDSAFTTHPGATGSGSPFLVPRILVRNWNAGDFAARLERWF